MSAVAVHVEALPCAIFPAANDVHWETQVRTEWNASDGTAEEYELVYEVSWISELGAWRRFLRSQRKVKG